MISIIDPQVVKTLSTTLQFLWNTYLFEFVLKSTFSPPPHHLDISVWLRRVNKLGSLHLFQVSNVTLISFVGSLILILWNMA